MHAQPVSIFNFTLHTEKWNGLGLCVGWASLFFLAHLSPWVHHGFIVFVSAAPQGLGLETDQKPSDSSNDFGSPADLEPRWPTSSRVFGTWSKPPVHSNRFPGIGWWESLLSSPHRSGSPHIPSPTVSGGAQRRWPPPHVPPGGTMAGGTAGSISLVTRESIC